MGTNYYLTNVDGPRAPNDPGIHVGKLSFGWEFTWRAHPSQGLTARGGWDRLIAAGPVQIVNEYGTSMTVEEFNAMVNEARRRNRHRLDDNDYRDPQGNFFVSREFS